ncbi:alpha/beta fold hydrolase [Streptomyces cellulosae]
MVDQRFVDLAGFRMAYQVSGPIGASPLVTADTLVLTGGPTSHVPQDGVAELARRVPRARLLTIPVGHLIHDAAPEAISAVVSAFLTP